MTFRPLPFLGNPHVQTILGNLWRGPKVALPTRMHVVALPDGDALAIHETTPPAWLPGSPTIILVHGLGGSHQSGMMRRLTNCFTKQGIQVFRVDLRGAGAGVKLARRVYNAACAGDVRTAAEYVHAQAPTSLLVLLGFSLGANIVLNVAGQAAARPIPNLQAVAAISPPVDLVLCSAMLAKLPFYDGYYARNLRRQVRLHEAHFPDLTPVHFPERLTMRLFDDIYTAPKGGFADAMDYYRLASSLPIIPQIQVPTFILSARDDPYIPVPPLEKLQGHPNLHIHLVPKGGHLGFLGRTGNGSIRWGEETTARWIMTML
jgi:predicted alpha/beta-fold hydrolase